MRLPAYRVLPLGIAAFVAVLASAAHVTYAAGQEPANQRQGPFKLADDEFWTDIEPKVDPVVAELAKSGSHGIVIDAPKRVLLTAHDTLPVVGYFARSLEDDRLLDQERQMLVVAVNPRSEQVFSGTALQPAKMPAPRATPRGKPGKGTAITLFHFDLRQKLELPWGPGVYRVTVLLGRFISNTVTVELAGGSAAPVVAEDTASTHIEIDGPGSGNSKCRVSGRLVHDTPSPAVTVPQKIVLLVTGQRAPGPWTLARDVSRTGKETLEASFGFDVLLAPEMPRVPGLYFVYAFSSWGAAGPVQCRLDAKSLLRTR